MFSINKLTQLVLSNNNTLTWFEILVTEACVFWEATRKHIPQTVCKRQLAITKLRHKDWIMFLPNIVLKVDLTTCVHLKLFTLKFTLWEYSYMQLCLFGCIYLLKKKKSFFGFSFLFWYCLNLHRNWWRRRESFQAMNDTCLSLSDNFCFL